MRTLASLSSLLLASVLSAQVQDIRLPRQPQVSPDGEKIAFVWQEDIWLASSQGGDARRITSHTAADSNPHFSPDGTEIAFISSRSGGSQIHVVAVDRGTPGQITHDSNRKSLFGYTADGSSLVIAQGTDRSWSRGDANRLYTLAMDGQSPKKMVFDAGFASANLSPDGTKVLFTKGRAAWNRKGYSGAQAAQLWLADLSTSPATLTRLDADRPNFQNISQTNPLWGPDSETYYYVSDPDGTFDVYQGHISGAEPQRITQVGAADKSDDGVAFPSISADGKTIVFRRRFDLQRFDIETGEASKLALTAIGDSPASIEERRSETGASNVAFTEDGKQMAFVAGQDVYVMDRILKEPVRITSTPHQESSLVFSADGKRLFFVSDAAGEVDIWEATQAQADGIWWLAEEFTLRQITNDRAVERELKISPNGESIAFVRGTDLYVMDPDGNNQREVITTWSGPDYDWSPDGKWVVYATQDSDYNHDVWVAPIDKSRAPFNLSRHPDRDNSPVWSGDGKRIAFISRREGEESDIYYINLAKADEEKTERDALLEEAIAAMKSKGPARNASSNRPGRAAAGGNGGRRGGRGRRAGGRGATPPSQEPVAPSEGETPAEEDKQDDSPVVVKIDFEEIHDRMHRISNQGRESGLIWSPDGKKLGFSGTVGNENGFFTIDFPDVERPKKFSASAMGNARWLKQSKEIVGTTRGGGQAAGGRRGQRGGRGGGGGGTPAAMNASGKVTSFAFSVRRTRDWSELRQIAFDQGWRAMRDRFYDGNMNNRDWDAVRAKFRPVAGQVIGASEFSELMNMMLGELNASHMSHRRGPDPLPTGNGNNSWSPTTVHLGARFADDSAGPGLVVSSVIPGSPANASRSKINPGDVILSIDGQVIGPDVDVEAVLTMEEIRELDLTVANADGVERTVKLMPVRSVQGLLYNEFIENTRKKVDELSGGRLGYLHIRGMNMPSFRQMETDLFHAGDGKDGLIIDVRNNGGGSTTDHVLTALTQPVHAITRSRGSGEGYPQDRKVYASWSKPIVVLCNENSFSNAEIFSHAVKQIGRGRVVGMRTAGGVISTGSANLLDGSSVRMPTRGWYLVNTGEDMELNGCLPDIALWNPPNGEDMQLQVAVKALQEDVAAELAKGRVNIEPAAAKRLREKGATNAAGKR